MGETGLVKNAKTWSPIAVVPNVDVNTKKLSGAHIALIGATDSRYRACIEENADLKTFLERFTGSHGEPVGPSLIVVSEDYGKKPNSDAVASFKDIVVAAVGLDVRVSSVLSGNNHGPFYSNSFDIYPWMISERKDRLIARTPALSSVHHLKGFRGLTSPALPEHRVENGHVRGGLFKELYRLWERQYIGEQDDWKSRSILRSLNMATAAMQVPNTSVSETIYDWGRVISLWVSAFEILVHPGGSERADEAKVLQMLSEIEWRRGKLEEASHPIRIGRKAPENHTLAELLYHRLYKLRNDYLHGNPVDSRGFEMENGTSVLSYPAALYRMALSTKVLPEDIVTDEDVASGRRSLDEYSRYYRTTLFQNRCEDCLMRAVDPDAME